LGNDFRAAGESNRFADAEDEAHGEERGKGSGGAGDGGSQRPDKESDDENARRIETVHHPTDDQLHGGVGGKKGGEEDAKLRRRELKFVFEQRRGHRKIAAVDVVNEDADAEQDERWREAEKLATV